MNEYIIHFEERENAIYFDTVDVARMRSSFATATGTVWSLQKQTISTPLLSLPSPLASMVILWLKQLKLPYYQRRGEDFIKALHDMLFSMWWFATRTGTPDITCLLND